MEMEITTPPVTLPDETPDSTPKTIQPQNTLEPEEDEQHDQVNHASPRLLTPASDDYQLTPRDDQATRQTQNQQQITLEMSKDGNESNLQLTPGFYSNDQKQPVAERKMSPEELQRDRVLFGKLTLKTINQGMDPTDPESFFNIESLRSIQLKPKKPLTCTEKLVIMPESRGRQFCEIFMLFLNAYSCFTSIFYVSFGSVDRFSTQYYFDYTVEFFFLIDLILNFFVSFTDPDTFQPVRSLPRVAKRYLCGWFLIDLVAILPLPQIFGKDATISKLLRLLRLPRLLRLINLEQLEKIAKVLFEFSSRTDRVIAQQICVYSIRILRTFFIAIVITYFLGCIWYFITDELNGDAKDTFKKKYLDPNGYDSWQRLTICCYFVLTTLATVGYGDLAPQTDTERAMSLILMIIGAGFFSIILSDFIAIINNFEKKMGVVDKGLDLHNWMTLLSNFTSNKPLPRTLFQKIETHFQYYWKNDRMSSLKIDDPYVRALPSLVKRKIISNYLYSDVFFHFRHFFNSKQFEDSEFLYEMAFGLLPRKFCPGYLIYDELEQVEEMYLITSGIVNVGFKISQREKMCKRLDRDSYIGAYYCIANKPSQFVHRTYLEVKALGIRKEFLNRVLAKYPVEGLKVKENVFKAYQDKLKSPVVAKRSLEIEYHNELNPNCRIASYDRQDVLPELRKLHEDREELQQFLEADSDDQNEVYARILKRKVGQAKTGVEALEKKLNNFENTLLAKLDALTQAIHARKAEY